MQAASTESRNRGFERFLLFTDAVMAISVTLLILPLIDSVGNPEYKVARIGELLSAHQGDLLAFLLSFMVILALWIQHQQVFAKVAMASPGLVVLGMLWLLSVTLLPFTTALIPDHADEHVIVLLYVGNVTASIYCLGASTWLLDRQPHLMMPDAQITTRDRRSAARSVLLMSAAFVLVVLFPGIGFSVMFLLILDEPLRRLWQRFRPE